MTVNEAYEKLVVLLPNKYFTIEFELNRHSSISGTGKPPEIEWTIWDGNEHISGSSLESAYEKVLRKHEADKNPDTIQTAEQSLSQLPTTQP